MHCPYCGSAKSRVTDSRDTDESIRRRRECTNCGVRFTTYEHIQGATLMVVKRDGRREEYNREKLSRSIRLACVKRPLPTGALDKLIDEIKKNLQHLGKAEISSAAIGEITIGKLREIDRVAYIRYASVYRDFEDLEQFKSEIESLQIALQETKRKPLEGQLELLPSDKGNSVIKSRKGRKPSMTAPKKKEVNTEPAMT